MLPLSPSQREALEEAVTTYEQGVTGDAARYLMDRGIEEGTALTHRLGVVSEPLPGHEGYRGMLAIPYLHRSGHPLTIRFRRLHGDGPKYMSLTGDRARIYNTAALYQAGAEIHVTEGEFDAMILNQIGLPSIAIPGANGWAYHYSVVLAGFSRVWVWGDPDAAGGKFVSDVSRSLRQARGVRIRGGDVTDVYLEHGAAALHELVSGGEK